MEVVKKDIPRDSAISKEKSVKTLGLDYIVIPLCVTRDIFTTSRTARIVK
jgi:hypothetical protein